MDYADQAQDEIEQALRMALARRGAGSPPEVAATGFCLNCGEKLAEGVRWCDAVCRDEWAAQREAAASGRG